LKSVNSERMLKIGLHLPKLEKVYDIPQLKAGLVQIQNQKFIIIQHAYVKMYTLYDLIESRMSHFLDKVYLQSDVKTGNRSLSVSKSAK